MFLNSKNCPFAVEKRVSSKYTKLALAAAMGLFAFSQSGVYADEPTAPVTPVIAPGVTTYTIDGMNTEQAIQYPENVSVETSYEWVEAIPDGQGQYSADAYYIPTYNEETGQLEDHYYTLNITASDSEKNERYHSGYVSGSSLYGHYIDLHQESTTTNAVGGGIYFNPTANVYLDNVVGDFINDSCTSANNFAHGGALDNHGIINNVVGDFIGNRIYTETHTSTTVGVDGAGLRNGKIVGSVVGNFIGNVADAGGDGTAWGGGIANHKSGNDNTTTEVYIGSVDGAFISNMAKSGGGAIYNNGATIGTNVVLVFDENNNPVYVQQIDENGNPVFDAQNNPVYVQQTDENGDPVFDAQNNPVYVQATEDIGHVNGYFINNQAGYYKYDNEGNVTGVALGSGGAIYNTSEFNEQGALLHQGIVKNLNGTFIANTATENGGAFYNTRQAEATIGKGDFYINTAENDGGAFYNTENAVATINEGNFVRNEAGRDGGAIYTNDHSTATITKGNFIENTAGQDGGAIYTNNSSTATVTGDFVGNEAGQHGGALYTNNNSVATVTGNFIGNKAGENGGAVYSTNGSVATLTGDFIANSAKNGGAIYNDSDFVPQQPGETGVNMTVSGNLVNNTATVHGGAIYSKSDINLDATGETYVIDGNTAGGQDEAIYMEGAAAVYDDNNQLVTPEKKPTINLMTNNGGRWIINDNINGTAGLYNVNMNGGGVVSLYGDITGGNVSLNEGTTLDTINNETHTYNVNEFTVTGDSAMNVDVDIQSQTMDRIATADGNDNQGNTGKLDVQNVNFMNDSRTGSATILFAEEELAHSVLNNGVSYDDDPDNNRRIITPARIYDIGYRIHNDDNRGYFEFSNQWNPAILAAPVVLQAGVQSAMNTTMLYAFNHLDTYTKIPKFDRLTMMNGQNRYALSTDFNDNNSPLRLYNLRENRTSNQGVWLRPYAMFESIPLKNGPKVDSITYGSFLGFDSDFHEHKHGWHSVWSTYLGYQGGQLDFRGVSANLNGGVLGITDTFYKGNFWTALTLTGGAMNADISTMYGHEDSVSIYGGIASKTGYNFEFKDGKYILQPIMLASYTFANMLDYKNAAGVKIDANTMHTIQMNPSLRFITNLKNGWQPYAKVGMVWNFLNETDMNAYGYHLPDMHIKPYVEYGLGIQKLYNHRFTGFAQAMMRNGGRNGVAVTLGFRYALGREGSDEEFSNMSPWEKFKAFFK